MNKTASDQDPRLVSTQLAHPSLRCPLQGATPTVCPTGSPLSAGTRFPGALRAEQAGPQQSAFLLQSVGKALTTLMFSNQQESLISKLAAMMLTLKMTLSFQVWFCFPS